MVMADEYAQYSCSSDEADPVPEMEVSIKDQEGRSIEVQVERTPKMKGRKGFAARVVFEIHFDETIKTLEIVCKAVNEVGEAVSSKTVHVQCKQNTNM